MIVVYPGDDVKLHPVTKAQFSTIEVLVAMPMTRWELRIVPCLAGGNRIVPCLCNMPQDAGHAFCRCAMTAPMSLFYSKFLQRRTYLHGRFSVSFYLFIMFCFYYTDNNTEVYA